MSDTQPPTDQQLNAWIRARLRLIGVDLDQLPETEDPETGSPTRAQALASLREFLRETIPAVSDWRPEEDPALQQQVMPPVLYPAPHTAWTGSDGVADD
jgi:hypothetical protein